MVRCPCPVVDTVNAQLPSTYSAILTPYIRCMISGVPKPFSAMWRAIGTIRSARVPLGHSTGSTTGRLGWMNPIAAPSTQLVPRGAVQEKLHRGTAGAWKYDVEHQ